MALEANEAQYEIEKSESSIEEAMRRYEQLKAKSKRLSSSLETEEQDDWL